MRTTPAKGTESGYEGVFLCFQYQRQRSASWCGLAAVSMVRCAQEKDEISSQMQVMQELMSLHGLSDSSELRNGISLCELSWLLRPDRLETSAGQSVREAGCDWIDHQPGRVIQADVVRQRINEGVPLLLFYSKPTDVLDVSDRSVTRGHVQILIGYLSGPKGTHWYLLLDPQEPESQASPGLGLPGSLGEFGHRFKLHSQLARDEDLSWTKTGLVSEKVPKSMTSNTGEIRKQLRRIFDA